MREKRYGTAQPLSGCEDGQAAEIVGMMGVRVMRHRLETEIVAGETGFETGIRHEDEIIPEGRLRLDAQGEPAFRPGDLRSAVPSREAIVDPAPRRRPGGPEVERLRHLQPLARH